MKNLQVLLIAIIVLLCSYSNKNTSGTFKYPPSDPIVNASVNRDNNGHVLFTASVANAINYDFDFGNGDHKIVPAGIVDYRYPSSGTYSVKVISTIANGERVSKSIQVKVTVALSLIWSDEFERAGSPGSAKWGYDTGNGSGGWGNNELEYYTSRLKNAVIENGVLKINAIKESYNGSAYTSARLLTKDKFSFKYGKIEVKAKLPAGLGTWPAIWMLGSNVSSAGWPACGEIDIMEHRGRDLNKIFGTLHHPGHSGANGDGSTLTITNATSAFHNYIAEWSPKSVKFYVDTQLYYTFNNAGSLPFNQSFFIILNLAIGGNFAGPVDPAFTNASMEVDYIRVYQ